MIWVWKEELGALELGNTESINQEVKKWPGINQILKNTLVKASQEVQYNMEYVVI
jgi:hypothetical protein